MVEGQPISISDHSLRAAVYLEDPARRILVPQSLRERAELGEEVTFVGSGEMVRVFGSRAYDGIVDAYQRMMRENPDALGDLGI